MVDTFEIIEKPEICQFSENLGKMIIRNKNSSLTCVYMTVRLDDATICDKLPLYCSYYASAASVSSSVA